MKKITFFLTGAILLAGLILVSTAFKPLTERGSANGQGGITINNRVQQFSFHANTDRNGNVSGSWESNSPGQNCRTHGNITCLTILADGKTAIMSGVVTQVVGDCFGATVGTPIWFTVQDNGEGSNSPGDRFTDYYFFTSGCGNYGAPLHLIENGNIQVKP